MVPYLIIPKSVSLVFNYFFGAGEIRRSVFACSKDLGILYNALIAPISAEVLTLTW